MSEVGELRHEVVQENGTGLPLLHVYLPEGLAFSDVDVTTGSSPDVAEVFIEHVATKRVLGLIQLQGYTIAQEDSIAKLNRKHRRYTIRLAQVPPPAAVKAGETASSASPTKASGASAATASAADFSSPLQPVSTVNIFGLLDNDDISDSEDGAGGKEGAAGAGKEGAAGAGKKKKKKGKKAGAGTSGGVEAGLAEEPAANGKHADGGGPGAADGRSNGDEDEVAAALGGEGGAAKKMKQKKGAAGAAPSAAAADASATMGGTEAEVEAEEAARPGRSSSPPTLPEPAALLPASAASSSPSAAAPAPLSKSGSRALGVDLVGDFGEEQLGSFEVGTAVPHDPLLGPVVYNALGKVQIKGEDKWLEAPSNSWSVQGLEGAVTPVSAFGIFDGHGGRMAAQYAAKQLLPLVARFAERAVADEVPSSPGQLAADGYLSAEQAGGGDKAEEGALQRARVAAAQDSLIARLPKALRAGFVQCDEDVISRHKASGTTATLAVQVGWELLVANVGDSLAYLDTGSEIVVISANHRVAENSDEQKRIVKAGGRIKPAKYGEDEDPVDGHPGSATPHEGQQLRVWPGGINMTRTIGDESAKGLLIAEPAVRQISLPVTGARLIIASDGLWDAVNAKTIIGQLRTCNAREAASKAAVYAMRNKKHDDDVTVVVADFVPRPSDTHVPGLLKRASGPAAAALAALAAAGMKEERAAQSWRPLETPSESWRERHRAHRRRAAAYLRQLDLAEKAEVEAAEELERQRRMAVAPAAGTAGVGTANRPPPVSDLYRELADIKVDVNAIHDLEEAPAATGGDDWTEVETNKKKDGGSKYVSLTRELSKVARPGEARQAHSPAGGGAREERDEPGGRRERRERGGADRERRLPRRERDGVVAAATSASVTTTVAVPAADSELREVPEQHQPRGERREKFDRRDRGGRGDRGREGAAIGGPSAGPPVTAEAAELGSAHAESAPPPPAPPGVVKAAGYLFVPKSLLTGGAAAAAAAATASAASGTLADDGKPRRERGPRSGPRNRNDGGASTVTPQENVGLDGHISEQTPAAGVDTGTSPVSNSRRTMQKRHWREKEAAAAAGAAAAIRGMQTAAAPAPATASAPPAAPTPTPAHAVATSNDPVLLLEPASGHRQRRQQQPYGVTQAASFKQTAQVPRGIAGVAAQYSTCDHHGAGRQPAESGPASVNAQFSGQPQRATVAAPPPPTVPTYAGPLDFGAGFGPGSGNWPPSAGGMQYGGFQGNGSAVAPQRPLGMTGGAPQRSSDEVAAAAAAAAAAAVARKAAAASGGGQYVQGRR